MFKLQRLEKKPKKNPAWCSEKDPLKTHVADKPEICHGSLLVRLRTRIIDGLHGMFLWNKSAPSKIISSHFAVAYYKLGVLDSFIVKYYMKNEL